MIIGVSAAVQSEDQVPLNAKRLIVMLEKAGFTPYGAPVPQLQPDQFQLVIGGR